MVKIPKVSTGISLPKPIMEVIDAAAAGWYCDRGQAITLIVQEWKRLREKHSLPEMVSSPEAEELKAQEYPGLIPDNLTNSDIEETDYLGTGPGDEVEEAVNA
jgi:hypothetical protein